MHVTFKHTKRQNRRSHTPNTCHTSHSHQFSNHKPQQSGTRPQFGSHSGATQWVSHIQVTCRACIQEAHNFTQAFDAVKQFLTPRTCKSTGHGTFALQHTHSVPQRITSHSSSMVKHAQAVSAHTGPFTCKGHFHTGHAGTHNRVWAHTLHSTATVRAHAMHSAQLQHCACTQSDTCRAKAVAHVHKRHSRAGAGMHSCTQPQGSTHSTHKAQHRAQVNHSRAHTIPVHIHTALHTAQSCNNAHAHRAQFTHYHTVRAHHMQHTHCEQARQQCAHEHRLHNPMDGPQPHRAGVPNNTASHDRHRQSSNMQGRQSHTQVIPQGITQHHPHNATVKQHSHCITCQCIPAVAWQHTLACTKKRRCTKAFTLQCTPSHRQSRAHQGNEACTQAHTHTACTHDSTAPVNQHTQMSKQQVMHVVRRHGSPSMKAHAHMAHTHNFTCTANHMQIARAVAWHHIHLNRQHTHTVTHTHSHKHTTHGNVCQFQDTQSHRVAMQSTTVKSHHTRHSPSKHSHAVPTHKFQSCKQRTFTFTQHSRQAGQAVHHFNNKTTRVTQTLSRNQVSSQHTASDMV